MIERGYMKRKKKGCEALDRERSNMARWMLEEVSKRRDAKNRRRENR